MPNKAARYVIGTDDNSVRCIVSLLFNDNATTEDVAIVMAEVSAYALERFTNGPHEEARQ